MRRKQGQLVPIEIALLEAAFSLRLAGLTRAHGTALAQELKRLGETRKLAAYGTLYRALARLEKIGFLSSEWEDPLIAAEASRPRRRYYEVTTAGEEAYTLVRDGSLHRIPGSAQEPEIST